MTVQRPMLPRRRYEVTHATIRRREFRFEPPLAGRPSAGGAAARSVRGQARRAEATLRHSSGEGGGMREQARRQYEVVMEKDVPMRTRDGVTLYADVWRPDEPGRYPVLLSRTPYGKDGASANPNGSSIFFARYGYVTIMQEVQKTVTAYAQKEGIAFVLTTRSKSSAKNARIEDDYTRSKELSLLYGAVKLDITEIIVKLLDAAHPKESELIAAKAAAKKKAGDK